MGKPEKIPKLMKLCKKYTESVQRLKMQNRAQRIKNSKDLNFVAAFNQAFDELNSNDQDYINMIYFFESPPEYWQAKLKVKNELAYFATANKFLNLVNQYYEHC